MQPHTPVGGLIKGGDPGECQRQPVEGAPGIGAGPGSGVAADHPLGVDKAALDFCFWPARCDRGGGPSSTVDDGNHRGGDRFDQPPVVVGGFACAPSPGDDVVDAGGDD